MKYTSETAPRGLKIMMDHAADPIWVDDPHSYDDPTPVISVSEDMFNIPPTLRHLLQLYRTAWQAAYSSKYIALESMDEELEANPRISNAIKTSLNCLGRACEEGLEEWLTESGWSTELYRQDSFD